MIALSGVRSSCDMFARNSLFEPVRLLDAAVLELELDRALADLLELAALAQIDHREAHESALVAGEADEVDLGGNLLAARVAREPLERRELGCPRACAAARRSRPRASRGHRRAWPR